MTKVTMLHWWVVPADLTDDEVRMVVSDLTEFPTKFVHEGQRYVDEPVVRRGRTRVLITQRIGLDI